jgi:hypothetical protein
VQAAAARASCGVEACGRWWACDLCMRRPNWAQLHSNRCYLRHKRTKTSLLSDPSCTPRFCCYLGGLRSTQFSHDGVHPLVKPLYLPKCNMVSDEACRAHSGQGGECLPGHPWPLKGGRTTGGVEAVRIIWLPRNWRRSWGQGWRAHHRQAAAPPGMQ